MLFVFSFFLSGSIVLATFYQARRLFEHFNKSIEKLTRLERGLSGTEDIAAFQAWLIDWPMAHPGVTNDLVNRLKRLCKRRPLHGWIIDPNAWCDGKVWFRMEPGIERILAMPGMLTGIGILFTFLGLTIGIFGLDPTDPERLTQGVRGLLGGMSLAFLTSIGGIGSALWWTWRTKLLEEAYSRLASRIESAIREKPFFTMPEEVPNHLLEKMSLQNQYLSDMENTMMVAFRRALEDQGWIQIQEAIARMLGKNDVATAVAERLDGLMEHTAALTKGVEQSLLFQEQMVQALEKRGSVQGHQLNWNDPGERAGFLADTQALAGNVARIHGAQEEVSHQLVQTAESLKQLMESARIANADIIITHKQLATQLERLEKHWDGYREQVLAMQKSLRMAIETFQKRLQTTLQTAHGEIDELLGQSLNHFTTALESFEATMEGFSILLKTGQLGGKKGKWLNKVPS